jgi:hypothetical protein
MKNGLAIHVHSSAAPWIVVAMEAAKTVHVFVIQTITGVQGVITSHVLVEWVKMVVTVMGIAVLKECVLVKKATTLQPIVQH